MEVTGGTVPSGKALTWQRGSECIPTGCIHRIPARMPAQGKLGVQQGWQQTAACWAWRQPKWQWWGEAPRAGGHAVGSPALASSLAWPLRLAAAGKQRSLSRC